MQILVGYTGATQQAQVTTVTLAPDLTDPQGSLRMYMFHCPRCGSPVAKHAGFVFSLFPGMVPTDIPILSKCSNKQCVAVYFFKSIVGR